MMTRKSFLTGAAASAITGSASAALTCESVDGSFGRARGLLGGAFMGCMLASQGGEPFDRKCSISIHTNAYDTVHFRFDTGIDSAAIYRIRANFMFLRVDSTVGHRLFTTNNSTQWRITLSCYKNNTGGGGYVSFGRPGGGSSRKNGHMVANRYHSVDISYQHYILDGTDYGPFPEHTRPSVAGTNLSFFAGPKNGDNTDQFDGVFQWAKIFGENDTLIADYQPCVKDGRCLIYDYVSKNFIENELRSQYGDFVEAPIVT